MTQLDGNNADEKVAEELRHEAQDLDEVAEVLEAAALVAEVEAEVLDVEADELERHHVIHFSVDGEHFETRERELTPDQILKLAGLNPKLRYLTEVKPSDKNFKDKGHVPIKMVDCMEFVSLSIGPTPTS